MILNSNIRESLRRKSRVVDVTVLNLAKKVHLLNQQAFQETSRKTLDEYHTKILIPSLGICLYYTFQAFELVISVFGRIIQESKNNTSFLKTYSKAQIKELQSGLLGYYIVKKNTFVSLRYYSSFCKIFNRNEDAVLYILKRNELVNNYFPDSALTLSKSPAFISYSSKVRAPYINTYSPAFLNSLKAQDYGSSSPPASPASPKELVVVCQKPPSISFDTEGQDKKFLEKLQGLDQKRLEIETMIVDLKSITEFFKTQASSSTNNNRLSNDHISHPLTSKFGSVLQQIKLKSMDSKGSAGKGSALYGNGEINDHTNEFARSQMSLVLGQLGGSIKLKSSSSLSKEPEPESAPRSLEQILIAELQQKLKTRSMNSLDRYGNVVKRFDEYGNLIKPTSTTESRTSDNSEENKENFFKNLMANNKRRFPISSTASTTPKSPDPLNHISNIRTSLKSEKPINPEPSDSQAILLDQPNPIQVLVSGSDEKLTEGSSNMY